MESEGAWGPLTSYVLLGKSPEPSEPQFGHL